MWGYFPTRKWFGQSGCNVVFYRKRYHGGGKPPFAGANWILVPTGGLFDTSTITVAFFLPVVLVVAAVCQGLDVEF